MAVKIVDASALAALLFGEPEAEAVVVRLGDGSLVAPALLGFEITSVCLKKLRRNPEQRNALLAALSMYDRMSIEIVEVDYADTLSGQYITTVSAHFPHRMAAAASLYGVGIITDKEDSPHLLLGKIKGELYYAFAETDQSVPAHIPGELKQALDKADAKHELKVFPGTHHGFCFPERAVYDTLAAEETWSKIFAMWDRCLK
jgi:uncharacterized protein with PIN domain